MRHQPPFAFLVLYVLFTALRLVAGGAFDDIPSFVPVDFDCGLRQLALEFALDIRPGEPQYNYCELFYALRIHEKCNTSCASSTEDIFPTATKRALNNSDHSSSDIPRIYVDADFGSDKNPGTKTAPVKSLAHGIKTLRRFGRLRRELVLFKGKHLLLEPLVLTEQDSFVRLRSFEGEKAEVTGCEPLLALRWRKVRSSRDINVWVVSLQRREQIQALRFKDRRVERARTPNRRVEDSPRDESWIRAAEKWLPRAKPKRPPIIVRSRLNRTKYIGTFSTYTAGIGGICTGNFVPNVSFWCNPRNPRDGGGGVWAAPQGLVWKKDSLGLSRALFNKSLVGSVAHVWHKHRWASQQYEVAEEQTLERTLRWHFGGFQDARASANGSSFYLDNALPFLDAHLEFFHDHEQNLLYIGWNSTFGSPPAFGFCSATINKLVHIEGNKGVIENVTIEGLAFKHTSPSFFVPHGVPSGGDWALQRHAAILVEGSKHLRIHNCTFERIDGNAVMLSKFNRYSVISQNRFRWIGGTAVAAWGWTDEIADRGTRGYDGTAGIFPRFTEVTGNLVLDVGLYQKQSAAFFQAKSMQTTVRGNIFGNGPRAGILINDGFGGGNVISRNILFNFCRESSDHGPFNSWDRQLYVFRRPDDRSRPSFVPLITTIERNLIIANYQSTLGIDHDDGSGWYDVLSNVVAYGVTGAKQDFGAHDLHHANNLYTYIRGACYVDYRGGEAANGHANSFQGNTCIQGRSHQAYAAVKCERSDQIPRLSGNTLYTPDGDSHICNYTLQQWQALGHDVNTKVIKGMPKTKDILAHAARLLQLRKSEISTGAIATS